MGSGRALRERLAPRQTLLARGWADQGRPTGLLPGPGAGAFAVLRGPSRHAARISRRHPRRVILPPRPAGHGAALAPGVPYQDETDGHVLHAILVDDAAGLIWLANAGSIEFHLWSARLPDLAAPDQAIFDLDPGHQAEFADVLRAALRLNAELERLGLRGYPKTSGGHGLHVYMPLAPGHTFPAVRAWVKALAEQLAAGDPELIAVAHGSTHRGRQVTIDHAQNSVGRNTAAPYTVRALPGAPVSAPLTWDEVKAGLVQPSDLTLRVVRDRVRANGDLFAPVLQGGQRLP